MLTYLIPGPEDLEAVQMPSARRTNKSEQTKGGCVLQLRAALQDWKR